jgi:hypothetical protein
VEGKPVTPYLLARTGRDGRMQYWEGRMWPNGDPCWTHDKHRAYHFSSARAAYEAADTHRALRNSDEWRVVPR